MAKKRTRRSIFNLCGLVMIGMILYPPFHSSGAGVSVNRGYHWIWDEPFGAEIDMMQLGLQLGIVIIAGAVLARVLK